jgi:hypothetical protein
MEKIRFHESIQQQVEEVEREYRCPTCGGELVLFDTWWLLYCMACPTAWAKTEQGLVNFDEVK